MVDLQADFGRQTLYGAIGTDEPLVRDLLAHFLRDAADPNAFAAWFEEGYLRTVFAETKLLHGIGEAQGWYGMLGPTAVKALRERVEIDFTPDNPRRFGVDDAVRLKVALKNTPQVILKTYEINTVNWYRGKQEEVTETVDLDGLVSSDERTLDFTQAPLLRHIETFELAALNRPGVWVVECIGNGRSSRALVRKGRLRLTERVGAAGHVFRVYDDAGARVTDASILFGGKEYSCADGGEITVPFSTAPQAAKLVVRRGDFACLHGFRHLAEEYRLEAGFLVDPESLLPGSRAAMLVRVMLTVHGAPVDVALLEEVALTIRTTDRKGIETSTRVADVGLKQGEESLCEFPVPEDLRAVAATLSAKVPQISTGKKVDLQADWRLPVGTADAAMQPAVLLLRRGQDGFWLELLGKGGEPFASSPVDLTLTPRLFREAVRVTLATDATGRIPLGPIEEIEHLHAESLWASNALDLPLRRPWVQYLSRQNIVVAESEPVLVADDGAGQGTVEALELRGGTASTTPAFAVERADGLVSVRGLAAGEYLFLLKPAFRRVTVTVLPGARVAADILARDRALRQPLSGPLQIASAAFEGGTLRLRLAHAGPDTRVHVLNGRFLHPSDPVSGLGIGVLPPPHWHEDAYLPTRYISGRVLGDEIRYVFERRYADAFPGNMLQRPSLLLNPWLLRETRTTRQDAREGESWGEVAAKKQSEKPARGDAAKGPASGGNAYFRGIEEPLAEAAAVPGMAFLAAPSRLWPGLRPDPDGTLTVELGDLGQRQQITVVACNDRETVCRRVFLPVQAEPYRDLRLSEGLDPALPYGEARTVVPLTAAEEISIQNASAARVQTYISIADVFTLFESLTGDPHLAEFRFVLDWPEYTIEKKHELYSKYACHELHVFLARKDPAFFAEVVRPYLANGRQRTLVDAWLLGGDLRPFLEPWQWQGLNAFERVAVAKALPEHAAAVRRGCDEVCALLPHDPQAELELFLKALQGRGVAEGFGLELALQEVAPAGYGGMASASGAMTPARTRALSEKAAVDRLARLGDGPEAQAAAGLGGKGERKAVAAEAHLGSALFADLEASLEQREALGKDKARRELARRLYVTPDATGEYAETRYWKVPLDQQLPERVPVNRFWADWARHDGEGPFVSTHVAEATASFSEMLLALAVLDLPCRAEAAVPRIAEGVLHVSVPGPGVCYRKELRQQTALPGQDLLVRQEFIDPQAEPERTPYGERPRRIPDAVPVRRVVQCSIAVANATADPVRVDVLLQVPEGAVPLQNAARVESVPMALEPFGQQSLGYCFYFPKAGSFRHYPATLSRLGTVVARAEPRTFTVTDTPAVDTTTWDYISQFGSDAEVLKALATFNLQELRPKLSRIAFRMRDKAFCAAALDILRRSHVFDAVLWSYGVFHREPAWMREYLPHTPLAETCGPILSSPVLEVDSVDRRLYEHREYWPLINARAHVLGAERTILNAPFLEQYRAFCERLAHRGEIPAKARLAAAVYLLLQDRGGEALAQFAGIGREEIGEKLPYDCLHAYLLFSQGDWRAAERVARAYEDYPVKRWRDRFREVLAQCDEIRGDEAAVVDTENRNQVQGQLADTEPALELSVENREVTLRYRNLPSVTVNYYLMDVELLFSRAPFVQDASDAFAVVRPNVSDVRELAARREEERFDLPAEVSNRNVLVEAVGAGVRRAQAYTPHALNAQLLETYGQVRVSHADSRKPLAKVYVKVYARLADGKVRFYKDGYTDLRGRFDYASLSTDDLGGVERFAVLVLSDEHGAVVREVAPPAR
ncbi:MAG: hypothetical protein JXR77_19490 [Lentisphaeria bacterium]|nr:hypothetical protein [Lentisphaeria bacterium]